MLVNCAMQLTNPLRVFCMRKSFRTPFDAIFKISTIILFAHFLAYEQSKQDVYQKYIKRELIYSMSKKRKPTTF